MPTYRVAAIFFVLPLLFLGLLFPIFLSAQQQDVCSAASETGQDTVTNDCRGCADDGKGGKRSVGLKCTVAGGGDATQAICKADDSATPLPAGSCEVTFKTPDGKTAKAVQTSIPSSTQKPPASAAELQKFYNDTTGEGSQIYFPDVPENEWLQESLKEGEPTD